MVTAAPTYKVTERVAERLLAHVDSLGRLQEPARPSARERLEHDLGCAETHRLVAALAGDHRMRVRELELVA
jgi:hypothetical protein